LTVSCASIANGTLGLMDRRHACRELIAADEGLLGLAQGIPTELAISLTIPNTPICFSCRPHWVPAFKPHLLPNEIGSA
jgi:hypothetical protein